MTEDEEVKESIRKSENAGCFLGTMIIGLTFFLLAATFCFAIKRIYQ